MYPLLPISRQIISSRGVYSGFPSFTGDNSQSDRELIANWYSNSPLSPAHMDWSSHYPAFVDPDTSKTNLSGGRRLTKEVEVVDIGCGFGGLMVGLAPLLPDTLMVGKYSAAKQTYTFSNTELTTKPQVWKSAPQCLNTSALASTPSAANNNASRTKPRTHHQPNSKAPRHNAKAQNQRPPHHPTTTKSARRKSSQETSKTSPQSAATL